LVALAFSAQDVDVELPPVRVKRHRSEYGEWEIASGTPHPRLRGWVRSYTGFTERATSFTGRLETPSSDVTFIVNLGSPFCIRGPDTAYGPVLRHSFLAAMHERFALAGGTGPSECMEVKLTPIGAHLLLGIPMDELSNRTIELDDLLGPLARLLAERLAAAPDWASRFAILDAAFLSRLACARPAAPGVVAAWSWLRRTHGCTDIGALADGLGWSRKHLIARFREQVGLPPKTVASILRFNRAVELMSGRRVSWSTIALESGYYDQAHMIRDFRRFAGTTPTDYLARRLPDDGGVMAG
jgi:AraC-like DNA-binding protein